MGKINDKPIRTPGLVYQQLPDENELMIVDEKGGTAAVLNDIAGAVWLLCDGEREQAELVRFITDSTPGADTTNAGKAVENALALLAEKGLIK